MKTIKVQCPAKINLTLKIVSKRKDGFHNIESIMQTINLYDYLDITVIESDRTKIILDGNSDEIPYDKTNLVYKAAELFLNSNKLKNYEIHVFIEKNIPVSAGLAGGSTNGAGMLFALNKVFNNIMNDEELNTLCAKLGSDLNFCLKGGRAITRGRGEIIEPKEFRQLNVNLIKPINLGISAKEAYTRFAQKTSTDNNRHLRREFVNDLEWAIIDKYPELQKIRNKYPTSVMTGSGSTYFSTREEFKQEDGYWIKNGLTTIPDGIKIV